MVHARPDYNRFQDPALLDPSLLGGGSSPIAEGEPVILFRAKDKHFASVVQHYIDLIESDPEGDQRMVQALLRHLDLSAKWQAEHGVKTPDLP